MAYIYCTRERVTCMYLVNLKSGNVAQINSRRQHYHHHHQYHNHVAHQPDSLLHQRSPCSPSLLTFVAILILDSDGNRILSKYYNPPHLASQQPAPPSNFTTTPLPNPYPTVKDQKTFEKGLFDKTKKQTSDVILFDNKIVVYKQGVDCTMYVVGNAEENEVMLYLVVAALRDCLDALLS